MNNTQTARARIDRGTHHVVLPVPKGHSTFSIAGNWFDDEWGPTVVTLICRTGKASRNSEHVLTRDAAFPLPETTNQIEVRVNTSTPSTSLEVTVTTTPPQPRKHARGAIAIHQRAQQAAQR